MARHKKDLNVCLLFMRIAEQERDEAQADAEAQRIDAASWKHLFEITKDIGVKQELEITRLREALAKSHQEYDELATRCEMLQSELATVSHENRLMHFTWVSPRTGERKFSWMNRGKA